jgi:hypothetical protein
VCWPSEPTKDSIEIKLPEAGKRLEGTAAYHSPLTSYVALWAFRGAGCAPKSGGLRTNGSSCVALRAKAKQPEAGERRGDCPMVGTKNP